jgi:hypothetical protein
MYAKYFPRELTDTMVGDPCIPMDGYSFIWNSKMFMFCRYNKKIKNEDHKQWKTKDECKIRYKT